MVAKSTEARCSWAMAQRLVKIAAVAIAKVVAEFCMGYPAWLHA
jgi:hypothetical protein